MAADHKHEEHPAPNHRGDARPVGVRVITVSDTREGVQDKSGAALEEILSAAGHTVSRARTLDDKEGIAAAIAAAEKDPAVRAIVLTGGTGVARRDVTAEVVLPLLEKELPGFGEIFRALSFAEIGSAAILSRAVAGVRGSRAIFALPGSSNAVKLAATRLIVPELSHILRELDK